MSEIMENGATEESTKTEQQEKSFTQADLDRLVEQRIQRERKKFERQIEGIDLDEARKMLTEKEAAETERQKERGNFDALLKSTVEKKDAEIASYRQRLHTTLIEGQLLAEANKNNAVSADQVSMLLHGNLKLADDGHVDVLDNNNTVRYNSAGEPMSVSELVSEFLTANPHFVRASSGGTGSRGNAGGSTQKPQSVADMVSSWNDGGREAYAAMKKSKP